MLTYAESSDGVVLMADGIGPVLRWDGYETTATKAGVDAPGTAAVISASGAGSITGTYTAYVRFVDKFGNYSNYSPVSNSVVAASNLTITYSSVPVPQQGTVVRRQILRNLAGNVNVYYVDIDTTDIGSTTFSSTKTDLVLATQQASVPNDDSVNYGVPPDNKPIIVYHQNRMYAAGIEPYRQGSCEVTFGGTTVVGRGTEWQSTLAGRYLHISAGRQPYLISSVDVVAQTLVISQPYRGPSDIFAAYAIKPAAAESNTFYYSQANLPEAWNPSDALTLPEDGDEVTGMMNYSSFLYFLKKNHIYRLTTRIDPATDGLVSFAVRRGVINQRCWVVADETAYLLDEQGVYAYRGDDQGQPISTPIQDLFRRGVVDDMRINWQASRYFHACHSPQEETIRWFVALGSDYLPRHAICYNYKQQKWWDEKYPIAIGASVLGRIGVGTGDVTSSLPQYFLGSSGNTVIAPGTVNLDANPVGGTIQGTVTAAGPCSLSDSNAVFADDCIGAPVAISKGKGRLQVRRIIGYSGSRLKLDRPWAVQPNSQSEYVVGGIPWQFATQRLQWQPDEKTLTRNMTLEFVPAKNKANIAVRFFPDFRGVLVCGYPVDAGMREYTSTTVGRSEQYIDTTIPSGHFEMRLDGNRVAMTDGYTGRTFILNMSGIAAQDSIQIGTVIFSWVLG